MKSCLWWLTSSLIYSLFQSLPKCMNWISKSRTSRVATYFKMISGFCISQDWTHFLPPHINWFLSLKNLTFCLLFFVLRALVRLQWWQLNWWLKCYLFQEHLIVNITLFIETQNVYVVYASGFFDYFSWFSVLSYFLTRFSWTRGIQSINSTNWDERINESKNS